MVLGSKVRPYWRIPLKKSENKEMAKYGWKLQLRPERLIAYHILAFRWVWSTDGAWNNDSSIVDIAYQWLARQEPTFIGYRQGPRAHNEGYQHITVLNTDIASRRSSSTSVTTYSKPCRRWFSINYCTVGEGPESVNKENHGKTGVGPPLFSLLDMDKSCISVTPHHSSHTVWHIGEF